jgi:cytochrome c553
LNSATIRVLIGSRSAEMDQRIVLPGEALVKIFTKSMVGMLVCLLAGASASPQHDTVADPPPLPWAYTVNDPSYKAPADEGSIKHIPNTEVAMTWAQAHDANNVPDWHPNEHPPMPDVVVHGRKGVVRACGYCHYPNGLGRPENSAIAGLPVAYFIQQVADFRSGARKSSEAKMGPPNLMIDTAKGASDDEVKAAAEYFAALPIKPWIKVVETKIVPKSIIVGGMHSQLPGTEMEPLGERIMEFPEDLERTELRDFDAPFVAYVPEGSVKKGEALATTGGGKTLQCGICHGPDLRGLGPIPRIAGRSPSYIARQLYDIQHGSRNGIGAQLMKPAVQALTEDDIISLSAYVASLAP